MHIRKHYFLSLFLFILTTTSLSVNSTIPESSTNPPDETIFKPFSFPKELSELAAEVRIEMPPSSSRHFTFKINENTTNCQMQIAFYVTESMADVKEPHRLSLHFHDPNGLLLESLSFPTPTKKNKQAPLKLDKVGKYEFILKNLNEVDVVVDLVFGFMECHSIKHKLHKDDLITFKNRFNVGVMKQTVDSLVCDQ